MKRLFIMLLMTLMLTACGSSDNEVAVANTTPTTTTVTTTEATTTTKATTVTTTEVTTSFEDYMNEQMELFTVELNRLRTNDGLKELNFITTFNQCAEKLVYEYSANPDAQKTATLSDGTNSFDFVRNAGVKVADVSLLSGPLYDFNPKTFAYDIYHNNNEYAGSSKYVDAGFYYDPKSEYMMIIFTSPAPDCDTPYETLITYLEALINDDYEAYLAITLAEDNEETRKDFDYNKEGYVGVDLWDILYYETELNAWYGASDHDYKVVEFEDDGTYKFDINTFDNAYGIVRINELQSGGYYVWGHVRYTPFFVIN